MAFFGGFSSISPRKDHTQRRTTTTNVFILQRPAGGVGVMMMERSEGTLSHPPGFWKDWGSRLQRRFPFDIPLGEGGGLCLALAHMNRALRVSCNAGDLIIESVINMKEAAKMGLQSGVSYSRQESHARSTLLDEESPSGRNISTCQPFTRYHLPSLTSFSFYPWALRVSNTADSRLTGDCPPVSDHPLVTNISLSLARDGVIIIPSAGDLTRPGRQAVQLSSEGREE
jgi:hypothetical protein